MYKVLIVDDEPIILSGIKFLIDWKNQDTEIVGTVRNGNAALELIRSNCPDIVICDINMPGMNGLDLLNIVKKEEYPVSFIMLTNYEDFDFVRQSMRNSAVDYLLKSQLEPETLCEALEKAKIARDNMQKLDSMSEQSEFAQSLTINNVQSILQQVFSARPSDINSRLTNKLKEAGITKDISIIRFYFDYSQIWQFDAYTDDDVKQLFESANEMIKMLLEKVFKNYAIANFDWRYSTYTVFIWNAQKQSYFETVEMLLDKVSTSCKSACNVNVMVSATSVFEHVDALADLMLDFENRENYCYNNSVNLLTTAVKQVDTQPIFASDWVNKIVGALYLKDIDKINDFFDKLQNKFSESVHTREDGLEFIKKLYASICNALSNMLKENSNDDHYVGSAMLNRISEQTNKMQLLDHIKHMKEQIVFHIENLNSGKHMLKEKINNYVLANINKRIMLKDLALHVCISPSYLSALFKDKYQENLIDFVNQLKMKRACMLLKEKNMKIYEISYLLGYETAYYFGKLFKKYYGITPKEYATKQNNAICNETNIDSVE